MQPETNINCDLRDFLSAWPYDAESCARIIPGADSREILQVRTPVGIEQFELTGRPDGRRPHDMESALEFQRQRLAKAEAAGQGDAFRLSAGDCAELFEEGVLFYFRYLHLFQLKRWSLVVRDSARNIGLFDFVAAHARREQDRLHLEQWRPYILRIHATSRAMIEWEASHHARAAEILRAAVESIASLPDWNNETFEHERHRSVEALQDLIRQIEKTQPLTERELLEHQLHEAVESQEFERAATLRDRLRALGTSA